MPRLLHYALIMTMLSISVIPGVPSRARESSIYLNSPPADHNMGHYRIASAVKEVARSKPLAGQLSIASREADPRQASADCESTPALFSEIASIMLFSHGPVPETVLITTGQQVQWINKGASDHFVTSLDGSASTIFLPVIQSTGTGGGTHSGSPSAVRTAPVRFDSGPLAPGETFTHTFTVAGSYE
jgi:plastocyanin